MAFDLNSTDVKLMAGGKVVKYKAGATITAGDAIRFDVDNDDVRVVLRTDGAYSVVEGIALEDATTGDFIDVAVDGVVSGVRMNGTPAPGSGRTLVAGGAEWGWLKTPNDTFANGENQAHLASRRIIVLRYVSDNRGSIRIA